MKLLFDLFPVIVFFAVYKFADIYVATGAAIVATFVQVGWSWFRHRKVDKMLWVSLAVIVVFGGATLLLHDESFIKWKPTILYWLFGGVLGIAHVFFKKNLIREMMGAQLTLPNPVWDKLNWSWTAFFLLMGALNLFVAFQFSTDVWVNFKLFGGMGLMLVFAIAQGLMLGKYVQEEERK